MSKKLNELSMENELSSSAFFKQPAKQRDESHIHPSEPGPSQEFEHTESQAQEQATMPAANKPTSEPVQSPTKQPRYHDTMQPLNYDALIEDVRLAVKQLGKEAATYRFTEREKRTLAEIVYTYKRRDINTSGNEITRIGLNFILEDYQQSGANSILAMVLERLNA